jgi:hypothetical protein
VFVILVNLRIKGENGVILSLLMPRQSLIKQKREATSLNQGGWCARGERAHDTVSSDSFIFTLLYRCFSGCLASLCKVVLLV